jgi:hypothetical protein
MRTKKVIAAAALLVLLGTAAPSLAAPRPNGGDFTCRGSAARVTTGAPLPPSTIEPVVANGPEAPCVAAGNSPAAPAAAGPAQANLLEASTSVTPSDLSSTPPADGDNATATARVTDPAINLAEPFLAEPSSVLGQVSLPALVPVTIGANSLNATASYTCQGGQPVASSSSQVANLSVNGLPVALPSDGAPVDVRLGDLAVLHLNQTLVEPGKITRRALFLDAPLLGVQVVLAEATAGLVGNPCSGEPLAVLTPPGSGPPAVIDVPVGSFSCRASAARLRTQSPLPNALVEPVVANDPDVPCRDDSVELPSPPGLGPLSAQTMRATTTNGNQGSASASVTGATLDLMGASTITLPVVGLPVSLPALGLLTIRADQLSAEAGYTCQGTTPVASSSSKVGRITVNGIPIEVPSGGAPLDVNLGNLATLHLNQTVVEPGKITRRAFVLESALLGFHLVLAEAVADVTGNPCNPSDSQIDPIPLGVGPKAPTERVFVPLGTSRLSGPTGCVGRRFRARVTGSGIASVTYLLDGRRIAVVRGRNTSSVLVDTTKLRVGLHRLATRVTFRPETRLQPASRVLAFSRCTKDAHVKKPLFTG